jgi:hypothetical protein
MIHPGQNWMKRDARGQRFDLYFRVGSYQRIHSYSFPHG